MYGNCGPVIYNLYGPIRYAFDAGKSITRASGRCLGPGNRDFFGPCVMASSRGGGHEREISNAGR